MKKFLFVVLSSATVLAASLVPSSSYAESVGENDGMKQLSSQQHELNGEKFDLVTWKDGNGNLIYTIPTEVKQKSEIAAYANNLVNPNRDIQPQGFKYAWSANRSNTDDKGRLDWSVSGYNEEAYLYPATQNQMVINRGTLQSYYTGSGNADKTIMSYSYTFNGASVEISYPPSLSLSNDTVSWTSDPVENQWYVTAPTLSASAGSRTFFTRGKIEATSDIYKGSYIYRPRVTKELSYPVTSNN
ncbi:hypothetical protein ASL14_12890 [Paenibacillus sp. IHB B 3084]|uniref:hypothetical protein n=1 Tax=Paenibacillus sp. IHB B 3084 TaxID=867076 RepID=UPI0007215DFA|nr:hypothetical protein [Paenibacillus sp. IHB B 3084]ALP36931.1 hypothetical protein ASL14_12890 [Paenibacillus sp. IHB B 3084]